MTDKPTIAVICSVERLPWHDDAGRNKAFGLNVSAAFYQKPGHINRNWLLPWEWFNGSEPQIQWARVDGQAGAPIVGRVVPIVPVQAKSKSKIIGCIKRQAEHALLEYSGEFPACEDIDPLTWSEDHSEIEAAEMDGSALPKLCDRLADLSHAPYPIPQLLHLAFVFRIDSKDLLGAKSIIARPFVPDAPNEVSKDAVEVLNKGAEDFEGIRKWPYDPKKSPSPFADFIAFANPCPVTIALDPADLVDWTNGWIRSMPGSGVGDWLAPLKGRVAEAFDLPQRLIDAYRIRFEEYAGPNLHAACELELEPRWYRNAILASLRDLVDPGLRAESSGGSLVDDLLEGMSEQDHHIVEEALENWIWEPPFPDLERHGPDPLLTPPCDVAGRWERVLVAALPNYTVPALEDAPHIDDLTPSTVAACKAYAGVLQDLHDRCLDPANLPAIVLEQWSAAFAMASPMHQNWWNRNRSLITERLIALPLRSRLLAVTLAPHWETILKTIDGTYVPPCEPANTPTNELARVPGAVVEQLGFYLKARLGKGAFAKIEEWTPRLRAEDVLSDTLSQSLIEAFGRYIPVLARLLHPSGASATGQRADAAGAQPAQPQRIGAGNETYAVHEETPAQTSPPLMIQAMSLRPDPGRSNGPATGAERMGDLFRRISGVGVMLRERNAEKHGTWRYLNLGRPYLANPQPLINGRDGCGVESGSDISNVLVATRPVYRDDLRQALIAYDNQPLACDAHTLGDVTVGETDRSIKSQSISGRTSAEQSAWPRLRYGPPVLRKASGFEPMPYLTDGREYGAACFVRTNCGALPKGLSEVHPANPKQAPNTDLDKLFETIYRRERRVPAGPLRVRRPLSKQSPAPVTARSLAARDTSLQASLPPFPNTVIPLARELNCTALGEGLQIDEKTRDRKRAFFFREGRGLLRLAPELLPNAPTLPVKTEWRLAIRRIRPAYRGVPYCEAGDPWKISVDLQNRVNDPEHEPVRPLGIQITYEPDRRTRHGAQISVMVETVVERPARAHQFKASSSVFGGFDVELLATVTRSTTQDGKPISSGTLKLVIRKPDGLDFESSPIDISAATPLFDPYERWGIVVAPAKNPAGTSPQYVPDPLGIPLTFGPPEITVNQQPIREEASEQLPLLLLDPWRPERDSFDLQIAPPTIEPITWDRWAAAGPSVVEGTRHQGVAPDWKETRIATIAAAIQAADGAASTTVNGGKPPIAADEALEYPEDPAIASQFICERVPLRTPPLDDMPDAGSRRAAPPSPICETETFQSYTTEGVRDRLPTRSRTIRFKLCSGDETNPNRKSPATRNHGHVDSAKEGKESIVEYPICPGEVWEVRIYPLVRKRYFDPVRDDSDSAHRFSPRLALGRPLVSITDQGATESYVVMSPFKLLIEGASSAMPTAAALWDGLGVDEEAAATVVRARFGETRDADTLAQPALAQWSDVTAADTEFVTRLEVLRQAWRHTGRPVRAFPAQTPEDAKLSLDGVPLGKHSNDRLEVSDAMRWEAEAFASRPEWDNTVFPRVIHLGERDTTASDAGRQPVVFEEDLSRDRRAMYYRIGLRAFSRYEGIIPGDLVFRAAAREVGGSLKGPSVAANTPWRRALARCRPDPSTRPARPKIRFIIPLTQSAVAPPAKGLPVSESTATPPLLVVLDEPWFAAAGLAESFVAEVERAVSPPGATSDHNPLVYVQSGPDPIQRRDPSYVTFPPNVGAGISPAEVIGPIGHTFDDDAELNPLYVSASFIVPPPRIPGWPDPHFGWYMTKLRFRRRFDPQLCEGFSAVPGTLLPHGKSIQFSPATIGCSTEWIGGSWGIYVTIAPLPPGMPCEPNEDIALRLSLPKDVTATLQRDVSIAIRWRANATMATTYPLRDPACYGIEMKPTEGIALRLILSPATVAVDDQPEGAPKRLASTVPSYRYNVSAEAWAAWDTHPSGENVNDESTSGQAAHADDHLPGSWRVIDATLWETREPIPGVHLHRDGGGAGEGSRIVSVRSVSVFESEATQGYWAQFIPPLPASALEVISNTESLKNSYWERHDTDSPNVIRISQTIVHISDNTQPDMFQWFAVATRQIQTAGGGTGEAPVGVFSIEPSDNEGHQRLSLLEPDLDRLLVPEDDRMRAVGITPEASLRIRLLGVQYRVAGRQSSNSWHVETEADLWNAIFSGDDPNGKQADALRYSSNLGQHSLADAFDATARPIGLGPPIDFQSAVTASAGDKKTPATTQSGLPGVRERASRDGGAGPMNVEVRRRRGETIRQSARPSEVV